VGHSPIRDSSTLLTRKRVWLIFYREDPHAAIVLPHEEKFLKIMGDGIVLSALGKCRKDDSLVIRVYNCTSEIKEFSLTYFKPISTAKRLNMKEEEPGNIGMRGEQHKKS